MPVHLVFLSVSKQVCDCESMKAKYRISEEDYVNTMKLFAKLSMEHSR